MTKSSLFRPRFWLSPQHEKNAQCGNVFVLWVQKAVTAGVQKAATPCHGTKSDDVGIVRLNVQEA
jgi:hypothetical protein